MAEWSMALPTFPEIRNPVREVMAALFFVEHPGWFETRQRFSAEFPAANLTE